MAAEPMLRAPSPETTARSSAAGVAGSGASNHQTGIRIHIHGLGVAVLEKDAQFMGGRPIDVFGSQVLEPVTLFLPVDERPVDVGLVNEIFRFISRCAFRLTSPTEELHA